MERQSIGELEQVVVLAILRLEERAYGVQIREEIRSCTGRVVSPGALYTTLERMERRGLVEFRAEAPTAERGGKAKNVYAVTAEGRAALVRAQRGFRSLMNGLAVQEEIHG